MGSSRISTLAPKYTARAIATDCRSPPDKVPTGWSESRMSMPIFDISSRVTPLAKSTLKRRNGQKPLVGSEPRKKFRQIDISGIIARSWYTVAIPLARASRGESNSTGSPSNRYSPSLGLCTPERVLMSVDLPAPLSPSRQVTSPARTNIDTSWRAITDPKYLETFLTSRIGGPVGRALVDRRGLGHLGHRFCAWVRMKLLKMTASTRIAPTNTLNQSPSTPVMMIPCCTMAKMRAPTAAPMTEP